MGYEATVTSVSLSNEEKKSVLAALPRLEEIARKADRVSDAEMELALPFLSRYPVDLRYADLAINRDRCCLIMSATCWSVRMLLLLRMLVTHR
jgi:hypothetical protein